MKEKIKQDDGAERELRRLLEESERQRVKLETQLARTSMEDTVTRKDETELEQRVGQLEADRARLESRLKKVVAENRRLKTDMTKQAPPSAAEASAEQQENAELRTEINHLAAEIVNLTAMLDGPNSEISEIIRSGKGRNGHIDRSSSIADRVRALREAALSAHRTRVE